jgi:hypothetical protein
LEEHAGWSARTTTLTAFAIFVPGWGPGAVAGEVDCDTLLKQIEASSKPFQFRVETTKQMIRVETRRDHCFETVALWARRDVPILQRTVPAPSTKAARGTTNQYTARGAPLSGATCDKELGDLWRPREVTVQGTSFWLSRVFTIDTDTAAERTMWVSS